MTDDQQILCVGSARLRVWPQELRYTWQLADRLTDELGRIACIFLYVIVSSEIVVFPDIVRRSRDTIPIGLTFCFVLTILHSL